MAASITDLITAVMNGGAPVPTTASAIRTPGATTLSAVALTHWPVVSAVHFVTGTPMTDAEGNAVINPTTLCLWKAIVSGTTLTNLTLEASATGSDPGNSVNDIIQMAPDSAWAQDLFTALTAEMNTLGHHTAITANTVVINGTGTELGNVAVSGWNSTTDTFVYASANTITVNNGALYQVGWRLKFTHNGVVKYAVIIGISTNTLTLLLLGGATLTNLAITLPFFSLEQCPLGMQSILVTSAANAGSGGGTSFFQVNADGTRELWGNLNTQSVAGSGSSNWGLNFPTGLFNSAQSGQTIATGFTNSNMFAGIASTFPATGAVTIYFQNATTSTQTMQCSYYIRGV